MTPVRNEAWVLNAFLKATSLWADYIIIADQQSTDGSREIALSYPKVILIDNNNSEFNESERQKLLIHRAREIEGDKILFALDADEVFSANFLETKDWYLIINSIQGDVFCFKWAQIVETKDKFWIPDNYFPWVFHDDGKEPHGNYATNIHSMRIPYPIEEKKLYYVDDFKVLHFVLTYPQRNVSKQRFYMLVDFKMNKRGIIKLSRMYLQKKTNKQIFQLSDDMISFNDYFGFDIYSYIDTSNTSFWFDNYVIEKIKQDGIDYYKSIDIWDKIFLHKFNISDPRNYLDKLLHSYLRNTQIIFEWYPIRFIDKILMKIGL